ncbi:hypothetical protein AB4455_07280 [Vibrio sp. 10N.261.46.E12]|uniref:hypothetical protein n=1 Tax=unclassified Vibrio TaxID=2614977 RepID=UPI00097836CA|nr:MULTISPECIES: hypothetical protein [unclassified Vibrio]OMO36474.1 hypothetical protein BH584_04100 [Vibrio sp. 10N.261.45.E1]PMJ22140.1 hypothetical protein BCU27_17140 [Vibrio sp. 10N.286.45.B6]PML97416.1 hypothetical protein BCT66_21060 [Vibrio sp. 10N.261.49.E11]PMM76548.1 hypothetical protein BCT48_01915 [Vibrio sp. 10N.261.46.F12]PMM82493.1 hypothetical protein BCT46_14170 [Vibrio sp. 10N.261.46.E8]
MDKELPSQIVKNFNARFKPGDEVYYLKSEIEGLVKLRIEEPKHQVGKKSTPAYVMDVITPVVELEHIGIVEIRKVRALNEGLEVDNRPSKGGPIRGYQLSRKAMWAYIIFAAIFIVCSASFVVGEYTTSIALGMSFAFTNLTVVTFAPSFPIWVKSKR